MLTKLCFPVVPSGVCVCGGVVETIQCLQGLSRWSFKGVRIISDLQLKTLAMVLDFQKPQNILP